MSIFKVQVQDFISYRCGLLKEVTKIKKYITKKKNKPKHTHKKKTLWVSENNNHCLYF